MSAERLAIFFDVAGEHHVPVLARAARDGLLPVVNHTSLAAAARGAGVRHLRWEAFLPAEIGIHGQRRATEMLERIAAILPEPEVQRAFASPCGNFLEHTGPAFFRALYPMLVGQVVALEVFERIVRRHDVGVLVLGCDNSHIQRVLVAAARRHGIPSLQLAHGIYAPVRARIAGEMHTLYADYVAVYGRRASDVLVAHGNPRERILLTGAPSWDALYDAGAQMHASAARRRLGLDPDRPTVLFCGSYADGSSAFFPAVAAQLTAIHGAMEDAVARLDGRIQLLVRPHPHELERAGIEEATRAGLLAEQERRLAARLGCRVVVTLADRIACIRAADAVVVAGASTIIPEAMLLERPVVMVPLVHQEPSVYSDADGIVVARGGDRLGHALARLMADPGERERIVTAQRHVLPELNHGGDGRAAERIGEAVVRLAAAGPRRHGQEMASGPRHMGPRPLDVLFVVHDFLPSSSAGTEIYTYDLARALERRGHRVRVLVPRPVEGDRPPTIAPRPYQGLAVEELSLGLADTAERRHDGTAHVLTSYLHRDRPDLVHVQHLLGLSPGLLDVLRGLAIPVALTLNDFWLLCEQGHLVDAEGATCAGPESVARCVTCLAARMGGVDGSELPALYRHMAERRELHRRALTIPDLVLCPSRFLLDTFRRWGFSSERMLHAPQGTTGFVPAPRAAPGAGPTRLAYLGSIGRRKGLDLLIAAFNRIDTHATELHVHGLVTDRAYFRETMRAALPGKRIFHHGGYTPAELPTILAATDLAVVPSRGENSPFVLREILHGGVPVVAASVSGVPEIVTDGVDGLLFRPNDALDLAEKLAVLLADPTRIDTLRRAAGRARTIPSIDDEAREMEERYREMLVRAETATRRPSRPPSRPCGHDRPDPC